MQKVIDSFTLTTRHRKPENQDAAFTLSAESAPADRANMLISCVMDGVTTANGREAASITCSILRSHMLALLSRAQELSIPEDPDALQHVILTSMKNAIMTAHFRLWNQSIKTGSTVSLAVVFRDRVFVANVGDSPVYLLRSDLSGDVRLLELFQNQNRASIRCAAGQIPPEAVRSAPDFHTLVYCLGANLSEDQIFTGQLPLYPNDLLILGSDGALSVLETEVLTDLLDRHRHLGMEHLAQELYRQVSREPQATDNFTVSLHHLQVC